MLNCSSIKEIVLIAMLFLSFRPYSIYFSFNLFKKSMLLPGFSPFIFSFKTDVSLLMGLIETASI